MSPEGLEISRSIEDLQIYHVLANLFSESLFKIGKTIDKPDEKEVLTIALLIFYLRRWKVPLTKFRFFLKGLSTGPLGLRGHLISTQTKFQATNNEDSFIVPIAPVSLPNLNIALQAKSDVLKGIQIEGEAIANNNGAFHRALDVNRSVSIHPGLGSSLTKELASEDNHLMHFQYEHTALLFMSLSGIEFLLRSTSSEMTCSDSKTIEVINLHPKISAHLRIELLEIYQSDKLNIRNRCMHGSFLEMNGRQRDFWSSSEKFAITGINFSDLSLDGSLPNNVSGVVTNVLNRLAKELEASPQSWEYDWTTAFLLTKDEIEFSKSILFESSEIEGHRLPLFDYLKEKTPALSVPLKIGQTSWFDPVHSIGQLPSFYFSMLLLEPFLRLTLHLGGHNILQMPQPKGDNPFEVKYIMMDEKGLLRPAYLDWLTAHLLPYQREDGKRILMLATKCRDAIAHGALRYFDEQTREIYGQLIFKALLIGANAGSQYLNSKRP